MKTLVPLAVLAVAAPPATPLRFDPAEGTSVVKVLSTEVELALVDGSMSMGGNEEQLPDEFELTTTNRLTFAMTDVYARVADGVPARLERTHGDVEASFGVIVVENGELEDDLEVTYASALADEGIAWTWNEDDEAWEAAPLDEDATLPDELLEGLMFDYDALALLPAGEVAVGRSWTVEAEALAPLLGLGSDHGLTPTGDGLADDMQPIVMCAAPAFAIDELDGELDATLTEVDEDAGLATITLSGKVEGRGEPTQVAREFADALGGELEAETVAVDALLDLEGSLVWNLEAGIIQSLTLAGPIELEVEGSLARQGMTMTMLLVFEGQGRWSLAVE